MGISQKFNNSSIVLTVIHTFGAVIEQLSLTIEINLWSNAVMEEDWRLLEKDVFLTA